MTDGFAYAQQVSAAQQMARRDTRGFPESSWWLGLDRVAFHERARGEAARMRGSLFGRTSTPATAGDWPVSRARGGGFNGGE